MLCDRCKQREATCQLAYGKQPPGAGTWHLCDTCRQQFAPGFPTVEQIQQKIGPVSPGEPSCGWVSFSPDELRQKDERDRDPSA
jgi:hypothetical protein